MKKLTHSMTNPEKLIVDIQQLVEKTRDRVSTYANSELSMLYWFIGNRIRKEILDNKRAEYGSEILPTLSAKLVPEYGEGFGVRNLARMIKFAELFPDQKILSTLSTKLSWSYFVEIMQVSNNLARDFYSEMCRLERWSVRTLRKKIGSMLFERTAIAKKSDLVIQKELSTLREEDKISADLVFQDPYMLDFLKLQGAYLEKDLESAILRDLEQFIMELGWGFTFVTRQKRMIVDGIDFYLDLLYFHRNLKCLVAIELKLEKFKPDHKGQMELYLKWLDKYERKEGEEKPIGLILCSEKQKSR